MTVTFQYMTYRPTHHPLHRRHIHRARHQWLGAILEKLLPAKWVTKHHGIPRRHIAIYRCRKSKCLVCA